MNSYCEPAYGRTGYNLSYFTVSLPLKHTTCRTMADLIILYLSVQPFEQLTGLVAGKVFHLDQVSDWTMEPQQ